MCKAFHRLHVHTLYNSSPETYVLLFDNAGPDSCCTKRSSHIQVWYPPLSVFTRNVHISVNFSLPPSTCCSLTTMFQILAVPSARCTYPHIHVWYLQQPRFERKRADRPTDKPTDYTITLRCACAARVTGVVLFFVCVCVCVYDYSRTIYRLRGDTNSFSATKARKLMWRFC